MMRVPVTFRTGLVALWVLAPLSIPEAVAHSSSNEPNDFTSGAQEVHNQEAALRFKLPGTWQERQRLQIQPVEASVKQPVPLRVSGGRLRLGRDDLRIQVDYVRIDPREPLAGTTPFFRSLRRQHSETTVIMRPGLEILPFTFVAPDVRLAASLIWSLSPEVLEPATFSPELASAIYHLAFQLGTSGRSGEGLDLGLRYRNSRVVLESVPKQSKTAPFSGVRALAFTNGSVEGLITVRAIGPDQATVRRKLSELNTLFDSIEATLTIEAASK